MLRTTALTFIILVTALSVSAQIHTYHFSEPDEKIYLPAILHEVSGLTMIDQNTFACVQDEVGIVFFYNMKTKAIDKRIEFEKKGDFEGISEVNGDLFILRSDGHLTKIENYESEKYNTESYNTNIPAKDNEGLCYDSVNNRLLIGCKSTPDIKPEDKDLRAIYSFDLQSASLSTKPVLAFDVNNMKAFVAERGIKIPSKIKKNGEKKQGALKFKISAIAIHPISQELYLLSARDHLLFILDSSGQPKHVELLDEKLFNKAEGMTFLLNGDLLISNEGGDHKPTVLRFKMHDKN